MICTISAAPEAPLFLSRFARNLSKSYISFRIFFSIYVIYLISLHQLYSVNDICILMIVIPFRVETIWTKIYKHTIG